MIFRRALALCFSIPCSALAQDAKPRGFHSEMLATLGKEVAELVDDGRIAGAVTLVARDGEIAHFEAHGVRDLKSGAKMTNDTIFRIYSMSKPITTAAAMILVDEGKLSIDDPVAKHLPEFAGVKVYSRDGGRREPRTVMTVADLMRHTSGLTYGFVGGPVARLYNQRGVLSRSRSLAEMSAALAKLPLQEDPRSAWRYSVSTDLLGRVVEVASGKPFENFLHERIFEPLGMVDTAFHVPAEKLSRFASQNRRGLGGKLRVGEPAASSKYLEEPALKSGGGGLCSTARDYFCFCQMILNGGEYRGERILEEESVALMTSNQLPEGIDHIGINDARKGVGFGYGFSVRTAETGWGFGGKVGEIGWGGAASTHFWMHPGSGLAVITMRNFMPYEWTLEKRLKARIYDALE